MRDTNALPIHVAEGSWLLADKSASGCKLVVD